MTMESLPPSRQAEIAAWIYEAVRSCFAHWEAIPEYDLDMAFRAYLDDALSTLDRFSFDLATLRFPASLSNGHTAFSDEWLWQEHGAPIGFEAERYDDGWFITRSAVHDLEPGQGIVQIDGQPLDQFAEAKLAFVSGSSLRERTRRLFSRPYLFPRSFNVLTVQGKNHRVQRGTCLPERHNEPKGYWLDPGRQFQLTIPSFAAPRFETTAIEFVSELADDVHLTIDVRGNGGGNAPCDLIAALMPVPWRSWRYATPTHNGFERALGEPPQLALTEAAWMEPLGSAFGGQMTILIDGGTYSAAEDFVLPFKDNGRARIVGEPTGGSSGQPYIRELGDGMRLWVSTKRQYLPDGRPFEGIGIYPDVRL